MRPYLLSAWSVTPSLVAHSTTSVRRLPRFSNLCRWRCPLLGLAPVAWLVRERDFDPFGIERVPDPALHLPTNPPLFVGLGLDATLDHHGRVRKLVHAQHL